MANRKASISGDRLRIEMEFIQTPDQASRVSIRPVGPFTVYERRAIRDMLREVLAAQDDHFEFDTSGMAAVDPYGMGAILLLHGEKARVRRPFTLNVRGGDVGDYLNKYGVLAIVRHRAGAGAQA